jgi:tRNA threonylcarbamoyl adenosine modification protein YeaZ
MILAIETSSLVCGVSLHDEDSCVAEIYLEEERVHAEKLAVLTAKILEEQTIRVPQLDAVVVSSGPGSFTGLRIGMSFAKGLAYPQQLPLAGVNTMQAFVAGTGKLSDPSEHPVWIIRSHRDFVYMAEAAESPETIRIIYDKIGELRSHFPRCRHAIVNTGMNVEDNDIRLTQRPVLPSLIGSFYRLYRNGSAERDYDKVLLDYGMDYKPREWKAGGEL